MSIVVLLHVIAIAVATIASEPLPPFNLKCENNLVGLSLKQSLFVTDNPTPRFSWNVAHSGRSAQPKAFQVWVGRDGRLSSLLWDSGMVYSQANSIKYGGPPLESGMHYFWKVRWWDQEGKSEESEETGHFMTGILDPTQWELANWITSPNSIKNAPLLSQTFAVGSDVTQATLFISGLGFFKVFVNGQDLNSRSDPPIALTPGWTNYEVRVPYVTYSVTGIVNQSSDVFIEVVLGIGWRNTAEFYYRDPRPPLPDSVPRVLRVILNVTYPNGSNDIFVSDGSWKCTTSKFTSDSIYNGETYNASMEQAASVKAILTYGPSGQMYLPPIPPITKVGMDKAADIYTLFSDPDKQIVDFGNNSAGVCQLNVKDLPKNATVQIRHAEIPLHPPYGPTNGSLFYRNLGSALQTDIYTSDGVMEMYQPSFTYHGFRYAEVSGYPRNLTPADIAKVIIHSNLQPNGFINTSIALLNSLQDAVVRGQLSNLMSVPTDCDQRNERRGWMGDAGLSADSMALNFHMDAFHPHYLQLIADEQFGGSLPDIVPWYSGGNRPADPSWGAALPQIIWVLFKYYGDLDSAAQFYPVLMKYIQFMLSEISTTGIGNIYYHYGDWYPPPAYPNVNSSFPSAFSLLTNLRQAQEIASALGYSDDADVLLQLFQQQSESFNKAFLLNTTNDTCMYLNGLQVTYVLPLALGIVPGNLTNCLVNMFLNQLTGSDNKRSTAGIIGTKFLLPVLTQLGQLSLAMEVVQQVDYPSWGYMLFNPFEPATTLWERWNAFNESAEADDSRNHHMFSSVSGWMMTDLIGVSMPEGAYGFNEIHFHPARTLDLSRASVSLEHPKPISMSWQRSGGIQCAKSPEDQSSIKPGLPKHNGLEVSCGEEGVISNVLFASFGNPTGPCGYHKRGGCHAADSVTIVEKLCLGERSCRVPTDADFWGDPCPGVTKWLSVAVECKTEGTDKPDYKFSLIEVNVSIPVGSKGAVFLPAYGKRQLKVWEGGELLWDEEGIVRVVEGMLSSNWLPHSNSLRLDLSSGSYSFTVRGETPERNCLDSRESGRTLWLKCNSDQVISSVDWSSYGSPETEWSCSSHTVGECHAGSSQRAVERVCIGQMQCKIPVDDAFFGKPQCRGIQSDKRLIVEYACSER